MDWVWDILDWVMVLEVVTDFTEVSEVTEDVGFTEVSTEAVGFTEGSEELVDWVTEGMDTPGEVLELVDGVLGSPTLGLTTVVGMATATAEATGVDVKLTFLEHSMLNDDANLTAK